jgi:hypothetical protein
MERCLKGAGLADEKSQAPDYLPLLVAAREGAERQSGRPLGVKASEEQDDDEIDRGVGVQPELPPGVPVAATSFSCTRTPSIPKVGTSIY